MSVVVKTFDEIILMRQSAQLVSRTLGEVAKLIRPGVTTLELDKRAEEYIRDHGGVPGFLGMYDFPNSLCISPNEQVVHGIPNDQPLQEGDILSVDCGVLMNGFYGDHAYTFSVGEITPETQELLNTTKASLYIGMEQMVPGNRVGDLSYAIQKYNEDRGYGVVKELVGHGLGRKMHEDPQVPNYGKRGRGKVFKNGWVLAVEPMINMGTDKVRFHKDGWTVTTRDNLPSAHFEHDVAIWDNRPILLSTFDYVYEVLGIVSNEEDPFRWDWEHEK